MRFFSKKFVNYSQQKLKCRYSAIVRLLQN